MTTVTYIEPDGSQVVLEASEGDNLMKLAIDNGVEGILGSCGGSCMCATCHLVVDEYVGILMPADEMERDVLEMEVEHPEENSRLGCQVRITDDLESIHVTVKEAY